MNNVSVFIMTMNEALNIGRCLASVSWSNDIVVLDSGSADGTVSIASSHANVRVLHRAFAGYSDQRNFGLHNINYANDWVLVLDADEVVTPELRQELLELAAAPPPSVSALALRRLPVLSGRTLYRNITARFRIARCVRPAEVRYDGLVHEQLAADHGMATLQGALLHYQFAKGLGNWRERRRRYACLERRMMEDLPPVTVAWRNILRDHFARRALIKRAFRRMPAGWIAYIVYNFVVEHAYLDGMAGMRYVFLEAWSHREAARVRKGTHDAQACPPPEPASI